MRDVVAQLFVSRRTVEYQLAKVFVKLGVSSRIELASLQLEPTLEGTPAAVAVGQL